MSKLLEVSKETWEVEPSRFPMRTVRRNTEVFDHMEPFWAAMLVSEFIGAPQMRGEWEIERFKISKADMLLDYARAHGDGKGRWGRCFGDFIKLVRRHSLGGGPEGGPVETLMMSNTAQEMLDHIHPLQNAYGRVLVHGLGLSCLVSGLLARADVDHIDVVEIDEGIIEMVAPAYEDDPRITIHHGDCSTFDWPSGTSWNYVWHDIWATISEKNLHDRDEAENGIPYSLLHRKFSSRCDIQRSWAFDRAREQRDYTRDLDKRKAKWEKQWRGATYEERVEMLVVWHHDQVVEVPGMMSRPSLEDFRAGLEHIGSMKAMRKVAHHDDPPPMWWER